MKIIITESQYKKLQEQRVKGEEITPDKYVVHTSNPSNRDSIKEYGIRAVLGECYLIYADSNYGEDDECVPAIFATNSIKKKDLFDSTYDDDIWVIDTERAGVQWYRDAHFEGGDYKHIVTFEDIPVDAIRLIYKGTGGDTLDSYISQNDDTELPITENRRDKLFKAEFINLFNQLTPTRMGGGTSLVYIRFDDVYDDSITGLAYRPHGNELIIYLDYFTNLKIFVSSDEELGDLIAEYFQELTDKPVRYHHIIHGD